MIQACDFSTVFITSVAADAAAKLTASGVTLCQIGYDSSAVSAQVRRVITDAGMAWDCYRLPVAWVDIPTQVNDTIAAIHASAVLPGFYFLDIEPTNGVSLTIAQIEQAMDTIEAAQILPSGTLVKPGIYTYPGAWAQYGDYTGPADRGWYLWAGIPGANGLNITPFGGWTADQIVGVQYADNQASAIGTVDYSYFADRSEPIDPASALQRIISGRALLAPLLTLVPDAAAADAQFSAAQADITPA